MTKKRSKAFLSAHVTSLTFLSSSTPTHVVLARDAPLSPPGRYSIKHQSDGVMLPSGSGRSTIAISILSCKLLNVMLVRRELLCFFLMSATPSVGRCFFTEVLTFSNSARFFLVQKATAYHMQSTRGFSGSVWEYV